MSFDRSQKKPQDYQLPAGPQRCEPAFADSDLLLIDGRRVCAAIETGPGDGPVDPPPVAPAPPAPPAPRDDTGLLRVVALPAVCLVVGLTLGVAIGRATVPEAPAAAVQQAAPAAPTAATEGNATPGAERPAADQAAPAGDASASDALQLGDALRQ